jgi:beta-catenin-like protein 1
VTSEEEDMWYLRRLDNGLFTLQNVDYILAWIAMEDDGVCIMPLHNSVH